MAFSDPIVERLFRRPLGLPPVPHELGSPPIGGLEHGRRNWLWQARGVQADAQVLSRVLAVRALAPGRAQFRASGEYPELRRPFAVPVIVRNEPRLHLDGEGAEDRTSTRLNSSH